MSILGQALGNQKPRKRSDFYPTIDARCVLPLLAAIEVVGDGRRYAEPCAGVADLIHLLEPHGLLCQWGLEIDPYAAELDGGVRNRWPIARGNALQLGEADCDGVDIFITNPPWSRKLLHALIWHLAALRPTWLLFDASWAFTQQAAKFGGVCTDIVAVGRLKFFPPAGHLLRLPGESEADYTKRNGKRRSHDPPDDCAWYRFDLRAPWKGGTRYHFPVAREAQGGLL